MTHSIFLQWLPLFIPFICFGICIIMQLIALPIRTLYNYINYNNLKVGDSVAISDVYDYELGQDLPNDYAKITNIVYRKRGRKISYIELSNNNKMNFIQYNKIAQY